MIQIEKAKSFYEKNEPACDIAIFIAGFLFDILTLGNPDDWISITQQFLYLVLLTWLLVLNIKHFQPQKQWLQKIWSFQNFIFHFILGSLLSLYTLFFFKSSSIANSFVFLSFIISLMLLNEVPRFQKLGAPVKWALVTLSWICFYSILIPVLTKKLGLLVFILTMAAAAFTGVLIFKYLIDKNVADPTRKWLLGSVTGVFGLWVFFYFLNLIPPVPIALSHSGIYHQVEKLEGQYRLSYERPSWRFWENGAQTFAYRPGDQVFFYSRIFSPAGFRDSIRIQWLTHLPKQGWKISDDLVYTVSGGREQGYRIYTKKSNITAGDWQVRVISSDNREVGRIYFEVIPEETIENRQFQLQVD